MFIIVLDKMYINILNKVYVSKENAVPFQKTLNLTSLQEINFIAAYVNYDKFF